MLYIYICFVGEDILPINYDDIKKYNKNNNIILLKVSNKLSDYEVHTLKYLYDFCIKNQDYNVLYMHTKNVGKEINHCIEDQIVYILYFLVNKWKMCINKLLEYNTCGVDLRREPTLHYSGNFWWSTANHIISLPCPRDFNNFDNFDKYPNPLNSLRHNQEFWICYNKNLNSHFSLWDCGINCYERHLHRYTKEEYITNNLL